MSLVKLIAQSLLAATLLLLSFSVSADDALLQEAQWAEQQGDFQTARELYQRYVETDYSRLDGLSVTSRGSLNIRISVLDEAIRLGYDPAITLLLTALSYRDNKEFELAIDQLNTILEQYPSSYLRDDAQYLIGYIALMDQFDFAVAHEVMRKLAQNFPDSRYLDTALYSEAIALEQLGDSLGAQQRFTELRGRHSQLSFDFVNFRLPKSNMLSRYWFDRADKRLAILEARIDGAAQIIKRRIVSSRVRTLRVTLKVNGMPMVLLLTPSRLDNSTEFRDGNNRSIERPRAQFYTGSVEGEEGSWARVSIEGDSIEGVVQSYGSRFDLEPDTLVGTIDYYQPKRPAGELIFPPLDDYVMHPPELKSTATKRSVTDTYQPRNSTTPVSRVAQIGIVVDSQYNDYYGGNGLSQALSVLNVADGIFREDFGLALEVVSATVFSERDQDPMNIGTVSLETMLRNFRDYRLETSSNMREMSLLYLFSGNQNSDQSIGLAWIGAACRNDGFDVGVTTPSEYGDLLVTHELGHSLGAQHDSDTSCKTSTNRLMWPRISSLTEQEFTSCSRNALSAGLSGTCYLDSIDVSLEMSLSDETTVQMAAANSDVERVAEDVIVTLDGSGIDISSLPDDCVEKVNAEIECHSGMLSPQSSNSWSFQLTPIIGTGVTVMAEAMPYKAADVFTENNTVQLDIRIADDGTKTVSIASGEPELDIVADASQTVANVDSSGSGGAAVFFGFLVFILPLRRMLYPVGRRLLN